MRQGIYSINLARDGENSDALVDHDVGGGHRSAGAIQ
jgi:hypothetical protein